MHSNNRRELSIVRNRAYREQHWKGKQSKIPRKMKETVMVSTFLYSKLEIAFCYYNKWQVLGACHTQC